MTRTDITRNIGGTLAALAVVAALSAGATYFAPTVIEDVGSPCEALIRLVAPQPRAGDLIAQGMYGLALPLARRTMAQQTGLPPEIACSLRYWRIRLDPDAMSVFRQ